MDDHTRERLFGGMPWESQTGDVLHEGAMARARQLEQNITEHPDHPSARSWGAEWHRIVADLPEHLQQHFYE